MEETESGMEIKVRQEQQKNVLLSMNVTDSRITIDVSPKQF